MESFPKTYDVYCIDLPGWGVSEDPPFNLGSVGLERCYYYYANVIMDALTEIYPVKNAKFVFVGHSFGALILTKSIINDYIPTNKIHRCVLTCAPGLHPETSKYAYFWGTIFITGITESLFKQWWSGYLFSAFLYRKETQLLTLQHMYRFIPNGEGYKIVGRHMEFKGRLFKPEWVNPVRNDLIHMSKYKCNLDLIGGLTDTIVNPQHMKELSDEIKRVRYHELNGGHSLFLQKELFHSLLDIINSFPPKNIVQ
jgi:pimeloyl-ACP methyl ester carboxylesterase